MKPISSHKRYQLVINAIKEYILENNLKPGDKLPSEKELAKSLEVGRSSVREALKSLEVLGVLNSKIGEGNFVKSFSINSIVENLPYKILFQDDDLNEIMEVRMALEIFHLRKNLKFSEEKLTDMKNILNEMEQAIEKKDKIGYVKADKKFHNLLLEPVENKFLLDLISVFWDIIISAEKFADKVGTKFENSLQRHKKIYNAIKENNTKKLYSLLENHYEHVEKETLKY